MIPIENRTSADREICAAIEATVAQQRTLEDVVRWGLAREPRCMVQDVVVQDEYTHDVVLPYGDGLYLVYDTT